MQEEIQSRGKLPIRAWFLILLGTVCLLNTVGNAAAAPPECTVYVYASDDSDRLFTLMQNDSMMFGDRAKVVADQCESPFEISIDGMTRVYTNGSTMFNLLQGTHSYAFSFDDGSEITFSNVTVFSSQIWASTYYEIAPEEGPVTFFVDNSELQARDVMIALGTTLIVWATSTFIIWRFINEWVDRRYLEEVVQ
tara:strand:- start:4573 stop:5154 length:582 start_codon:yes stop_codon:yes gene_type:complete